MASSGKKNKKVKRIAVPLSDFLSESGPTALPAAPNRKGGERSWSDEVQNEADAYESRAKPNIVLPTAPRAARVPSANDGNVPNQPPYVAYISNLTYDVDETDLNEFFADMTITGMRLPKDDREGGKLKGFGYIEFGDRESLIEAISISETTLKGRRMHIEVAANTDTRGGRRGGRMEMGRDRPDRPELPAGDWRSGPRTEPESERRSGFGRSNDRERDAVDAPSNISGAWRDHNDRPSFKDVREPSRYSERESRSGGGLFGQRRNYNDREEGGGSFSKGNSREDRNSDMGEARSRPKLNLAPRTKPLEETPVPPVNEEVSEPVVNATPVPAAAIFGAAKPVDTSARERQIEERLAKEKEVAPQRSRENSKTRNEPDREDSNKTADLPWRSRRDDSSSHDSQRRESPQRRQTTAAPIRRQEDRRPITRSEYRPPQRAPAPAPPTGRTEEKIHREKRMITEPVERNLEDRMPKLKEQEAPNFAASNKYAFLEADDVSD